MNISSPAHDSLTKLTLDDQKRWLAEHIPHRVRSVLPGIPIKGGWKISWKPAIQTDPIVWRCMGNATWEGRLTSMRWLIMLVGIAGDKVTWKPTRPSILDRDKDVFTTRFAGTNHLFPPGPEAEKLALVWVGCSKATSHPTNRTNHPSVREPELAEALAIVINHLQTTIYAAAGKHLIDFALTTKSYDRLIAEW